MVMEHTHEDNDQGTSTPWLVYANPDDHQIFSTTTPLPPNNISYMRSIPQLSGNSIIGSCHEWLILQNRNNRRHFSLYNTFTLQTINDIPQIYWNEYEYEFHDPHLGATLTSAPDIDNPKSCVLFVYFGSQTFCCHPMIKNSPWFQCVIVSSLGETIYVRDLVALNGSIYCWGFVNGSCLYFLRIDGNNNDLGSFVVDFTFLDHSSTRALKLCYAGYLVESCGRIYSVFDAYREKFNRVCEYDTETKTWREVKCLGGRAFFLSATGCTWCWGTKASDGVQENTLYFASRIWGEQELYSCKLDDDILTFSNPCQNLQVPSGCEGIPARFGWPTWIMPNRRRLLAGEQRKVDQVFDRLTDSFLELATGNPKLRNQELMPQQHEKQDNLLCQLPSDIIRLIPEKLHLFDYWNFRAACKMFRSALAPKPQWRTQNSLPLFFHFKNDGTTEVKDLSLSDSRSNISPIFKDPYTIAFSKKGWSLILLNGTSLHFVNHLKNVKAKLPANNHIEDFSCIGFSGHPPSLDCRIVGYCKSNEVSQPDRIHCLSAREQTWKYCDVSPEHPGTPRSVIYHKGAYYFMSIRGYLSELELSDGEVAWTVHGESGNINWEVFKPGSSYLVECKGDLLSVFTGTDKPEFDHLKDNIMIDGVAGVKVYKFNRSETNWEKVDSLGEYSLFLGPSSFSVLQEHNMQNRIYLPRFKGKDMVYYSMDTGLFHVAGSDIPFNNLSYTRMPLRCCWV